MNKKIFSSVLLLCAGHGVVYADDSVSKQMQMLNSQIQTQLQQMQENQQKQIKALNDQLQVQMKGVQMDIQKQINDSFNKTQDQIKTVQTTLEKEIQQVNVNNQKLGK